MFNLIIVLKNLIKRFLLKRNQSMIATQLEPLEITINGQRSHDIQILDERFFLLFGALDIVSFGEAYIFGWWQSTDPWELMFRFHSKNFFHSSKTIYGQCYRRFIFWLLDLKDDERKMLNFVGDHYQIGLDYLELTRSSTLIYSCGYWKEAQTLEDSLLQNMDLIGKKLMLEPGMKVLDIGCGWGSLCRHLVQNYNVKAIGVDNGKEIVGRAQALSEGTTVEIRLDDYKNIRGEQFDRITCIEMYYNLSRVEQKNFFRVVHRLLKDGGLFIIQTDGLDDPEFLKSTEYEFKYVYPDASLPVASDILKDAQGLFVLEDWHSYGYDYYLTSVAELKEFELHWSKIAHLYGENYRRMNQFGTIDNGAAFKARKGQCWQIVFSKNGFKPNRYQAVR